MVLDGCDGVVMPELMQQLASCQLPHLHVHHSFIVSARLWHSGSLFRTSHDQQKVQHDKYQEGCSHTGSVSGNKAQVVLAIIL